MDKRKERTRRAIQQAFVELIAERGFSDVTVQDILDRTGVGRATFYAHFHGKEDLLAHQIRSICNHALNPTNPEHHHDFVGKSDPISMTEHVLCHLRERENGVRALVAGEGSEKFADCLRHEIVKRADEAVPEHPTSPRASWEWCAGGRGRALPPPRTTLRRTTCAPSCPSLGTSLRRRAEPLCEPSVDGVAHHRLAVHHHQRAVLAHVAVAVCQRSELVAEARVLPATRRKEECPRSQTCSMAGHASGGTSLR